jgi:hypothetical protein
MVNIRVILILGLSTLPLKAYREMEVKLNTFLTCHWMKLHESAPDIIGEVRWARRWAQHGQPFAFKLEAARFTEKSVDDLPQQEVNIVYCYHYFLFVNNKDSLYYSDRLCGLSSWLQIKRSRVRFRTLSDFLRSSGSGMGSTQPSEYN